MWIVKTEQDETGELFITLPSDLVAEMGWTGDTVVEWKDLGDGRFGLSAKENREDGETTDGSELHDSA